MYELMKNLWLYNKLKYLAFVLIIIGFVSSCDEEEFGVQSTKELLATASSETTVASGGSITFIDLSLGVASRKWIFPNGTPASSEEPEVEVVFSEAGDVVVTLEIEYYDGQTEIKEFPTTVFPPLIADFTPSATRIKVGESISFTDTTVGFPTSWSWEFEGGTPATSNEQNPTVQFNENNPITVRLVVTRAEDGSSSEVEKIIQVGPPELCLNGNFETGVGAVVDWQTWNGSPFPYNVATGGANGTDFTSVIDFKGSWGWGQIISRDFPGNKIALENGRDYIMSMYVRADAPIRLDQFRGVNHLPDWSPANTDGAPEGYQEFYNVSPTGVALPYNITTEWTKVSIQISVPDDGNSRTNFFPDIILGGGSDARVYIDEISVKVVE